MNSPATEALRTGLRRVRLATASLGVAALLGTGALTWVVAAEETATVTAESGVQPTTSTDDTTVTDTTSGGTTLGSDDSDDTPDASSGAS